MSTLREHLDEYLLLRRGLGFQLNDIERQVGLFLTWLDGQGQDQTFTIEQAVAWARLNPDAHSSWWATRLSLVRRFAAYLHAGGVDVPIIPSGLLTAKKPRAVPYIYSQDDVDALMAACHTEFVSTRVAETVRTIIGLLTVTGLRISEALDLRVDDIDASNHVLRVNAGKSPERLLPIHPTTTTALTDYLALPQRLATNPDPHGPVFVSAKGTAYVYVSFFALYKRVRTAAGLTPRGRARPRIHDLRHTAATGLMSAAYANGDDPERRLSLLSTWLGHSAPSHTYWYLTATGELLSLAAGMLETHHAGESS